MVYYNSMDKFFKRFILIFSTLILSICLLGIVLNCSGCVNYNQPPADSAPQQVNFNTSNEVKNNKEAQL